MIPKQALAYIELSTHDAKCLSDDIRTAHRSACGDGTAILETVLLDLVADVANISLRINRLHKAMVEDSENTPPS